MSALSPIWNKPDILTELAIAGTRIRPTSAGHLRRFCAPFCGANHYSEYYRIADQAAILNARG